MTWQDIVKQDSDYSDMLTGDLNGLLKEIKRTQKTLKDVHGVISGLMHSELISRYSEVYGGFLPKDLMVKAMDIVDEYHMADIELEKLMKEVAKKMAAHADVSRRGPDGNPSMI
jgi:hypothetical protein